MTIAKAGVIGWPISHSRSPLIHGYWLKRLGIVGSYERMLVEPGHVAEFLRALATNGFAGCNVTIPHKEAAFAAVEIADAETQRLGVVNTVFHRGGRLMGTSTDGQGFLSSVTQAMPGWRPAGKKIVMIGAGGAARAVAGTLAAHDAAEIIVVNRTEENAARLAGAFGPKLRPAPFEQLSAHLGEADMLINGTSLGMAGQAELAIDLDHLRRGAMVADLIYVPLETALIRAARRRGHPVVPGLGMLLHQAVYGFELWFGHRPEVVPELYDLVARDIDPEYRRP